MNYFVSVVSPVLLFGVVELPDGWSVVVVGFYDVVDPIPGLGGFLLRTTFDYWPSPVIFQKLTR